MVRPGLNPGHHSHMLVNFFSGGIFLTENQKDNEQELTWLMIIAAVLIIEYIQSSLTHLLTIQ